MSDVALPSGTMLRLPPVLRIAVRELQGGLRGFYVFIACLAVGVMTIAGVGSFGRNPAGHGAQYWGERPWTGCGT